MKRPLKENAQNYYQLKISLAGSKPEIWRRIAVPSAIRLDRLHDVIQKAMGWLGYHLHDFRAGGEVYGTPDPELEMLNESKFTLKDIAPQEGNRFIYDYDFGDSWQHEVTVEKILPPDPSLKSPVCLDGKNACPPEDCGGIYGYYNLLDAIKDPKHEDHESMKDWIGGDWDPKAFDRNGVNAKLRKLKT